jgi:hypothetical protein
MVSRKRNHEKPPWDEPAPKTSKHRHLSGAGKQAAKARAKKAGRQYPNLVDNMAQSRFTEGKP